MALSLHTLVNGQPERQLLSINNAEYRALTPAFEHFSAKTGLVIDPYSDLKMSSGFGSLINSLLTVSTNDPIFDALITALQQSEAAQQGVIFVGD